MDASYKIQRGIHVHLIQFFMCPEFWVHINKAFRPCVCFQKWVVWSCFTPNHKAKRRVSNPFQGNLPVFSYALFCSAPFYITYRCFSAVLQAHAHRSAGFPPADSLPQLRACFHSRCGCRSWSYPHSSDQECFAVCGYPRRSGT